eukprot:g5615.t1
MPGVTGPRAGSCSSLADMLAAMDAAPKVAAAEGDGGGGGGEGGSEGGAGGDAGVDGSCGGDGGDGGSDRADGEDGPGEIHYYVPRRWRGRRQAERDAAVGDGSNAGAPECNGPPGSVPPSVATSAAVNTTGGAADEPHSTRQRSRSGSITALAARMAGSARASGGDGAAAQAALADPISQGLRVGACALQGPRSSMEDAHVSLLDLECHTCDQWRRRDAPGAEVGRAPADAPHPWRALCARPGSPSAHPRAIAHACVACKQLSSPPPPQQQQEQAEPDEPGWLRQLEHGAAARAAAGADGDGGGTARPCPRRHAFFGVFDGHAGREAVEKALRECFVQTDAELLAVAAEEEWDSGATAAVLLLSGDVLITAHAGDSRLVLATSRAD